MLSQKQLFLHPKETLAVCLSTSMPASTKEARENGAGTAQRCVDLCSLSQSGQYQLDRLLTHGFALFHFHLPQGWLSLLHLV